MVFQARPYLLKVAGHSNKQVVDKVPLQSIISLSSKFLILRSNQSYYCTNTCFPTFQFIVLTVLTNTQGSINQLFKI